jgi:Domain of unknown function (DUF1929)
MKNTADIRGTRGMDRESWKFSLAAAGLALLLSAEGEALAAPGAGGNSDDEAIIGAHEADIPGRFDYGYGINVRPPAPVQSLAAVAAPTAVPWGGAQAKAKGYFGNPFAWNIVPLHVALLPDGRVFNFGTTEDGKQGGFVYDVWDPASGTHTTLPMNVPGVGITDIFCAGQSLLGTTRLLITGGDLTIGGTRNYSIPDAEVFNWTNNSLTSAGAMEFARWYPTIVPTPNGERVILGGRQDFVPGSQPLQVTGAPKPEVYNEVYGWRTLNNALNDAAYGAKNWYYPRGFQAANGKILIIANNSGKMFYLNPAGSGQVSGIAPKARTGGAQMPSLMYAPGKILSVRLNKQVDLIDVNGALPVVTQGPNTDQVRYWANTTVMADGRVFLNGGSAVSNKDSGSAKKALTWDPANPGLWSEADSAEKIRLYHSVALLMPDGSVLTAAGGAPGPVRQLNAEIYYPSYLYNTDGSPAARPTITAAPGNVQLGQPFQVSVSEPITRVTFLRVGSATHAVNMEQRFFNLACSGCFGGLTLTVTPPSNANFALPGYYMLFVFNGAGIPSVAKLMYLS